MTSSIFERVEMAPRDPILGLTESFNADSRPQKVNLGVGVYCGEDGKVPLLASVKAAEKARLEAAPARSYLPIDGLASYDKAVGDLLFGAGAPVTRDGRAVTIQTLGGTGALKGGRICEAAAPGRERAPERPLLGEPPGDLRVRWTPGEVLPVLPG